MALISTDAFVLKRPVAGAVTALAAGGAGLAAVAAAVPGPAAMAGTALITYGAAAGLILWGLPAHAPSRFGPANTVTVFRTAMVAWVAGCIFGSGHFTPGSSDALVWATVLAAFAALALDGVDGWLARRTGLASRFGARFDMEVDAALILLLSVAAWMTGKAGVWALAIGGMRYGFIAAQAVLPALRRDLAPSIRRKTICVVQVVSLCLIALPPVPPSATVWIALAALLLLTWSFARDVNRLLRQ
ncbi:CDP-alcohol phosphatidyltransferase family protein [Falsirhodobacter algicola]|uniref:CDP-alcohol phosphatidyltransferase family protein n=1 Tax=Falsirhodobacter algicola TaxID=2692330 RepID=A0A8J8MS96_9RHOB|nr:CDP-alcohol phosphatidyltransferase family protein [Falsirhodobacter algicola]QUS35268.1 CDP-alcohol phosphatidyltransferase family protein [Falsirhodobacter algicola]